MIRAGHFIVGVEVTSLFALARLGWRFVTFPRTFLLTLPFLYISFGSSARCDVLLCSFISLQQKALCGLIPGEFASIHEPFHATELCIYQA